MYKCISKRRSLFILSVFGIKFNYKKNIYYIIIYINKKKNMETKHMTKDEFVARLKEAVKRYKEKQIKKD